MGDGRWHLEVGDPTWLGWFAVAAYLCAAGLCVRAARVHRETTAHRETTPAARRLALFWWLLGGLLLALGINKQLDLQTLLIETLRDLAHQQGWYAQRQRYQRGFVALLAGVSVALLVALVVVLGPVLRRVRLALLGLGMLLAFILVRAALFQHVGPDWLAGSAAVHGWLELLCVGLLAWAASRERPRPH